jgi:putative tryptophan/tyrosine transport system substrate-binding protein
MMKRRDVLAAIAGGAMFPSSLAAQQATRRPRVGVLVYGTPDRDPSIRAFLMSMRELGYSEGENISYEFRFAEGKPERLPKLATDLVQLKPDVLFASGGDVAPWVAKATQTIPIIYSISADPVKTGLAASLARPGGNATGVTLLSDELAAKRIQLFKAAVPRISRVGFLHDPTHADNEEALAQRSAAALGVEIYPVPLSGSADLDRALTAAADRRIDGLYVVSSRHTALNIGRIVDFASQIRLPLVGGWGEWVQLGGLLSYGPNTADMVRQSATYVDRVLKGAKTSDLPVQQPTRFELHINLQTAKAFGLTIPEAFILLADRIIE